MVQGAPQGVLVLSDEEADPFPEEAAFQKRASGECATIRRVGAADPEGQAQSVAKQIVDLT